MFPDELVSREVAEILGCSERTVQRLADAGKIPHRWSGRGKRIFNTNDVFKAKKNINLRKYRDRRQY